MNKRMHVRKYACTNGRTFETGFIKSTLLKVRPKKTLVVMCSQKIPTITAIPLKIILYYRAVKSIIFRIILYLC